MGNIHIPPLSILAERLIADCGLTEFVETGTFQGSTLPWASSRFRRVRTIEIRADYQEQARQRVGNLPNVEFLLGDSGVVLREVCQTLAGPALFWLDAHAGADSLARTTIVRCSAKWTQWSIRPSIIASSLTTRVLFWRPLRPF